MESLRAAIARSLISKTDIILANNLGAFLPRTQAHQITEILRICSREFGRCVITITHNFIDAIAGERVLLFGDGVVDAVINSPNALALFSALEAQSQ